MPKFLSKKSKKPAANPVDQVIPLHYFEDGLILKYTIIYVLLVFDERLDPEKLHTSLETLAAQDGYRKIAGRLRKNAAGKVEYHVPTVSSPDRPAVKFSHVHFDMNAAEHPVASRIPQPCREVPAVVGDPTELDELFRGGNNGRPLTFDDFLNQDRSIMGVHVITFRDRTCVSVSWLHLAFDIMGLRPILDGWTLVMQGREAELPRPIGYDSDPLATLGLHPTEPHLLEKKRLRLLGMIGFFLRNLYTFLGPQEMRMVCIPADFWQRMVDDVRSELKEEAGSEEAPFVSECDVLAAWWTRLLCSSSLGRRSRRMVTATNVLSLRKPLADDLLPAGRPFMSLALGYPTIFHRANVLQEKPLSWLALEFRRALQEQGTREQVEAYAAMQRRYFDRMRTFFLVGSPGMYFLLFSNWQKAELYQADFSAAAVTLHDGPLLPSYIQCGQDPHLAETWITSGKDSAGNYWMSGYRTKGLWAKLERDMQRDIRRQKTKSDS